MQKLSLTKAEHVEYEQTINNSNLGLANVYADIQAKHKDMIGQVLQEDEDNWKAFLKESTGATLAASGMTGKSADRIQTLDLAQYLAGRNRAVSDLTSDAQELSKQGRIAAGQAAAAQKEAFTKVAFFKSPDFPPPTPVYRNVGMAAFQDALSIGSSVASMAMPFVGAGSDRKLKENIKKIGESISGLGIYKFNYIGRSQKWIGTMADEVKKIKPEAVFTMKNGFEGVRYDLIDVKMREAT